MTATEIPGEQQPAQTALPVLELAQHFAGCARQISSMPRDGNPINEMNAGKLQHHYAEMAAQLAVVSIAESLDEICRALSPVLERLTADQG